MFDKQNVMKLKQEYLLTQFRGYSIWVYLLLKICLYFTILAEEYTKGLKITFLLLRIDCQCVIFF